MNLKAYTCHDGEPHEMAALAFAITRNQARSLVCGPMDFEYKHTKAIRSPEWDKYAPDRPRIIEFNCQLPEGAPDFYRRDESEHF